MRMRFGFSVFIVLVLAGCGDSESGADATLQCSCVRDSFIEGFLDRTLPDGSECTNSAVGGCRCLASTCESFCAFGTCQPGCASSEDCLGSDEQCNELIDAEFGSLGFFCEFVPPCPAGTTGCPCAPGGVCDPPFLDRAEAFCGADNTCQINDLCTPGCRQSSVCCGGTLCAGDCIGTPCC